jgi:hypothetical protein
MIILLMRRITLNAIMMATLGGVVIYAVEIAIRDVIILILLNVRDKKENNF